MGGEGREGIIVVHVFHLKSVKCAHGWGAWVGGRGMGGRRGIIVVYAP